MRQRLVDILHLQHGEIGQRINADDLGGKDASIGQRDLDFIGAIDDMIIGDHQAGRLDDEAGTQ